MPKVYTEKEKIEIKKKLHEEVNSCLLQYGVKKTTVDELVKRVKIPKGTFYLFYKSKELLLFEVIQNHHERIEQEMLNKMMQLGEDINVDSLSDIICEVIFQTQNSCLKTLMIPKEMELLLKKLPQEVVEKHLYKDDELMLKIFGNLVHSIPHLNMDYQALGGAFRGIFFASMYQREIGEENYKESIRLMIKGLLLQVMA
ncbi:TetR/AcrR family transcriptional regulator [Lachnospiraceae bacterium LCP25S3_G4]